MPHRSLFPSKKGDFFSTLLAGIYEASVATVLTLVIGAALIIYGLPLGLFVCACWLHFRKKRYWAALFAMVPPGVIAVLVITYLRF